jgi:hypothetical protein
VAAFSIIFTHGRINRTSPISEATHRAVDRSHNDLVLETLQRWHTMSQTGLDSSDGIQYGYPSSCINPIVCDVKTPCNSISNTTTYIRLSLQTRPLAYCLYSVCVAGCPTLDAQNQQAMIQKRATAATTLGLPPVVGLDPLHAVQISVFHQLC